jgi:hypothetical protein
MKLNWKKILIWTLVITILIAIFFIFNSNILETQLFNPPSTMSTGGGGGA